MIRYDSEYNQKISRVVSNFNRKVRRLEKEEAELLPSKVSVREIKSMFVNKRDLNKYLNDLKRFSKRGAEKIVEVGGERYTKYDIDVFRARLRRERTELDREIARAEATKSEYPMQHNITLQNYRARREALRSDWGQLIGLPVGKRLNDWARKTVTYDNYFQILFQDAYLIGYDEEKLNHIREKLLELSPSDFISALENEPAIQEIFNYYHSLTRQAGVVGKNSAKAKFDSLYENIDEITDKYK